MSNTQTSTNGSSEDFKDFRQFIAGQEFPPLKKKIHILIVVGPDYIVFLDEKLDMHLWCDDSYGDLAEGFGAVLARQADLEATSSLLLKEPHLEPMRRKLAEAVGRLLDDRSVVHANQMLNIAAAFLHARSLERARIWYLRTMLVATSVFLIFGLLFWKYKAGFLSYMGFSPGAADVIVGLSMGSLGALLSVLLRSNRLPVDPSAGARVHYFEGVMRVLVGALAGAIFIMAVKTNILLSTLNDSSNSLTLLMLLSLVAGASEQLLPNLISRFSSVLEKPKIAIVAEENTPAANVDSNGAGPLAEKKLPHDNKKEDKTEEPANPELVEK